MRTLLLKKRLVLVAFFLTSMVQLGLAQTADFTPQIVANGCKVGTYRFNDATVYPGGVTTANVCYEWDFGNGNGITKVIATANSGGRPVTSPEASYTSSGTYNVRLRIYEHDGANCTNTLVSEVTKSVLIYDDPTPSFSTTTTFGCVPYTATFTNTTDVSSALVGAVEELTWNFGDGNSITTNSLAPVNHTYTVPGDYQVTLTVRTNAGGLVQCSGSLARPNLVRVRHTPTAGLTLSSAQPCAIPYIASFQSTSTIPSTPAPPGSITTYNWTFYDTDGTTVLATSSDQNPSNVVTYNNFGTYRATLQVTSSDGCTDIVDVPNAVVITDHTTDFIVPTKPPCVNEGITFTANTSAGATGYAWDFGDGGNSTAQNPTHMFASSGTFNVTLTTTFSDGCTKAETKTVTVNALPDATFSVSPTVGLCEVPKMFTFTPNIPDAPGITYQWNFGDPNVLGGGTSNSRVATHTYTDFGTNTVTLTVTLPGPEFCSRTETFNVPVLEPSLDFTFSPDPAKGCQPLAVTFTPTNIVANEAIASYIWTFGDGNSQTVAGPTPAPYTHTYTTGGTYSVTLEIVTTNGCRKSLTKNNIIFVGEPPVITDINFSRTGCRRDGAGLGITLDPVFGAVTADSVRWDFGDGSAVLADNTMPFTTTHLFNQVGNLTVTLRAYFNGCEVTVPFTKNIQIDGPIVDFTTVNNIGCAGGSTITFNNMTSQDALTGTTTYTWNFGDGTPTQSFTSKQAALMHTYASPGDYTVTVTATNDAGTICTDFASQQVRITASNSSFTVSATDVCRTTPVTFTSTSTTTTNGSIIQWQWDFGDGTVVTNTNGNPVMHTYAPRATPYVAVLTITEQDGCTAASAPINITVRGPVADFNTPATVCQNLAATFTDASTVIPNTNTITQWQWDFGDPASGVNNTATFNTSTNPTHQFSAPGTYTVTLTVRDNDAVVGPCTHTITKQITVLQPPVPTIVTPRDTFCTADPGPIPFDASGTTGNIISYTWDFGDGGAGTTFAGNTATPTHTYTADGLYTVSVTVLDVNGCSATFSKNIVTITPDIEIRANGLTTNQVVTCPPGNINFTATPLPNAATTKVVSWQWDFGDGNVANVQNPPTHTYLFPGNYTVTLTAVTEAGCTIVKTLSNFILVQGPEGSFSFNPANVCYTGTVDFQITGLSNASTYQLDFGNGTATVVTPVPGGTTPSTIINVTGTYNGPGVFTPILTLVDNNTGCTVAYPSQVGPVTASGPPTPNFTWNNGASGNICRNVQFTFTDASIPDLASTPNPVLQAAVSTREWTIFDGSGGGATPVATLSGSSINYTFPSAGNFDIRLKVTTGFGCTAEITRTVTVVEPNITANFTRSPTNICPEEIVTFDASTSTSTSGGSPLTLQYAWRFLNNLGTVVGTATGVTTNFQFPAPGDYDVELTVTDAAGCTAGQTVTQAVTVQPKPEFSVGPSDVTICSGDSPVTFSATVTAATLGIADVTYQWQVDDGGGFIDLNNNATYSGTNGTLNTTTTTTDLVLTNPGIGLTGYRFRCIIQQVNTTQCRDTTNIVTLTVNQAPTTANAGTDQNLCDANTTNLNGNIATIGTGQWTQVSGPPATIANPTNPTSAVNGLGAGVYVFRWTISNAPCPASTSEVTITNAASANAGLDQLTLCNATSATLNGSEPVGVGATGTWQVISGPAGSSFANANQFNTTISGLTVGTYELEWQIAGAPGCGTTTDRVVIQNNSAPTFTVQPINSVVCEGQTTTFTVNAGAINYQWQIDDGSNPGIFVNLADGGVYSGSTTATLTVTGVPNSLNNAKYRCVVTNATTSCTNTSNEVTLRVFPTPTTNASASASNICEGSNVTVSLDATIAGYQYQLRVGTTPVAGVATLTGTGAALNFAAFAPTATATYNVLVTTTAIGGFTCDTQLAGTFTVNVDQNPTTAVVGGNQDICGATTATLGANTPTVGTGQWISLGGLAVVDNPTNPNSTVSNLQVGANQFEWRITNGSCPASTATVTITRYEAPAANAGLNQTICPDNTTLNATKTPVAGVGTWTIVNKPAAAADPTFGDVNTANTTVSGLVTGSYTFEWTVTNGNCPPASDQVTIIRDASPSTANAGSNQTICADNTTLNAIAPTSGTGTWRIVTGGLGAVITNTNAFNSTITNLPVGATTLEWEVANSCGNSTAQVTITRDAVPTANAGLNQTICPDNVTLNATKTPASATGQWIIVSKPSMAADPVFSSTTSETPSVTGLVTGSYVFEWRVTNGTCPLVADQVTITRDPNPSGANAGPNQTLCLDNTTLAATAPSDGVGQWSISSGGAGAVITNDALINTTITNLPVGPTTLRWRVTNACGVSDAFVTITRDAVPTANAGIDQVICPDNVTLNATKTPASATGEWVLISGPNVPTFSSTTVVNPTVSNLQTGTYEFEWRVTNGTCPVVTDQVVIRRDPNPSTADAGPDQTICADNTTLAAVAPTDGTGVWTISSGGTGAVITNDAAINTTVTNLPVGATTLRWRVTNACGFSDAFVTITRDAAPSTANAGTDQTLCGIAAVMTAATPATGTGTWSIVSGSGTIVNPNSPTTAIVNLGVGANVFQWSVTNGTCTTPSSAQVTITRETSVTVSDAGPNQVVCTGTTVTLAANTPTSGTGQWFVTAGTGTFTNNLDPNTSVTGLSNGVNTFEWRVINSCATSISTVDIEVANNTTVANAGTNQTLCGTTSTTLNALPATVGTGQWQIVSGPGVINSPASNTSTVSGLVIGQTTIFRWRITNGSCPANEDDVNVTVVAAPVVSAGTNKTICGIVTTLEASDLQAGETGLWTVEAGSGVFVDANDPKSGVSGLTPGAVNRFRWTVTKGGCTAVSQTVDITSVPQPVVNAGSPQTICATTTILDATNLATGETGVWTVEAGTGTFLDLNDPKSQVSGLSAGINRFRWTATNGSVAGCSNSATVDINVTTPPTANAGTNQTVCATTTFLDAANLNAGETGMWTVESGTGVFVDATDPKTGISGLTAGATNTFRWTVSKTGCSDASQTVNVVVIPAPTVNAGSPQTVCATTAVLDASNLGTSETGVWTVEAGTGTFIDSNDPKSGVSNLTPGAVNRFRWTVSKSGCTPISQTVDITVIAPPTANAGTNQTVCATTTFLDAANLSAGETGMWTVESGTGVFVDATDPKTGVSNLTAGATNTFRWTVSKAGCTDVSQTVNVVVIAAPTVNAGSPQTICATNTVLDASNLGTGETGVWTVEAGTGVFVDLNDPKSGVSGLTAGTVNRFRWTVSKSGCTPISQTVDITVQNNPTTANAGANQTLCNVTSTALTANTITSGTGAWSVLSGPGTIAPADVNNPGATVSNLNATTPTVLRWTATNGVCTPSTDDVTITVNALPSASVAGTNQDLCNVTLTTMAATSPTTGVGTWIKVSGPGVISAAEINSPTAQVTGLTPGSVTRFQWSIANGTCTASVSTVDITVNALPTTAVAGANQTLCNVTTATLAATPVTSGTGTWSVVSGPGTIAAGQLTNPNATVSNLNSTTPTTLRWTSSNGSCTPSTDDVTITVNALPTTAVAGANQTLCNVTTATLAATPVTSGTGTWSVVSGPGTIDAGQANNPSATVSNLSATMATTFRWTSSNGSCTPSTDDVTITVNALPTTAVAGANQTLCNVTTATLAATPVTSGTGTWSVVSGPGTIAAGQANNPSATVNNLNSTTPTVLRWTATNGVCTPSTDDVTITVNALPTTAVAGANQTLCNVTTATLAATPVTSGTGTWSVVSGPGTIAAGQANNPSATVNNLNSTTPTVLRWTATNGVCTPSTDDVTITVNALPSTSLAGTNQDLCNVTLTTMAANAPTSGVGTWIKVSGPGVISAAEINSPTAQVTGLTPGSVTRFQWSIANGTCTASVSTVDITVNALPTTAVAGANQTLCNVTTTTLAATPVTSGTGTWSVVSGPGTIAAGQANNPSATVNNLNSTTPTVLRWTSSNGSCTPSTDDVTITVNALPSASIAGTNQDLCNVTLTTMTANAPTVGVGTWIKVSGPGVISAAEINSPTAQVTGLTPGSVTRFQWSIANGTCTASVSTVDITVNALPTTAVAGANQTLCNITTATLAATPVTSGTGTWSVVSGPGTISAGQLTNPNATVSNLNTTTPTVLRWTSSNGSCTPSTDDITITVNALPTTAVAGANQTLCNVTTATLAATPVTSGTGTWSVVSGPGTIDAGQANNPNATVSNLSTTTATTFRWTSSNGSCTPSTDDVTITVNALPTTAVAGANQTLCNVTTATLAATPVTSGTGTWSVVSGPGTISAGQANNPSATVNNLNSTTPTVLRWTATNGVCTPSTDDVTITVNALPTTAIAGANQTLCNVTTATLTATPVTSGTGTWSVVSGPGTIDAGQANNPNATVSNLSSATATTFRWTSSNGSCTPSTDDVTITVNATPTTAVAGANQTLCNVTTATLAATPVTSGTGTWSVVSGPGTIAAGQANNPSATVNNLNSTTPTVLRWTATNGVCTPSTDDVTITVNALPTTAVAGANQTLCNVTTATLAATPVTSGTGTWSVVSGPGTISAGQLTNPNATVSNLNATTPTILRWTATNGVCTPSTDDVTITVNALPSTSLAGTNQDLCNVTLTTMAANAPTSGVGTWIKVSGPGVISAAEINSPTAQVTGLTPGSVTRFQWSIANGTCTASVSTVDITVNALPTTAVAGANQTLCNVTSATLAATPVTSGTGTWSVLSGPGTISAGQLTNPNATVSNLNATTPTVLRWTSSNGSCTPSTDDVTITVNALPTTAVAGANQTLCNVTTATLAATPVTSGTGTWSVVSGPGTISAAQLTNPNATVSNLNSTTPTVLRWTSSNGSCTPSTDDVTITVNALPTTAVAGANQTLCNVTTATLAATPVTSGTGTWTVLSGPGTIDAGQANNPNATVSNLSSATVTTFRWTSSNGSCTPSTDDVTITVNALPTTAVAGANQTLCNVTTTTLAATPVTSGTGTWSVVSGPGTIAAGQANNPSATVNNLNSTTPTVLRWTSSNGSCTPSTDDVTITVNALPSASIAGTNQELCNVTLTTMAANAPTSGVGTWIKVSGPGVISAAEINSPTAQVTGLTPGSVTRFQWSIANGTCTASVSTVDITVNALPTTAVAGANQTLCNVTTATLAATPVTSGTGTWSVVSGPGTISAGQLTNPNATVSNLNATTPTVLRWTSSNGSCTPSTDDVTITVNATPTTAVAGANQTLCNVTTVTLAAIPVTSGTGTWSVVSGPGTIDAGQTNNPSATVSNLSSVTATTFRWTSSNGSCTPSTDDVTVTVNALPTTAVAGANQTLCNVTTATLAATPVTSGTGTWSVVSGPGTISAGQTNNPSATVNNLNSTTPTVLRWTATNGVCTPSTDDVTITVNALPSASVAGTNQDLCNVTLTTMAANAPTSGVGTWIKVSGPGVISAAEINSPTAQVTGLTPGSVTRFQWSIANGTCTASVSTVDITVNALPTTAVAGANQTLCNVTTATLAATPVTSGTGTWTVLSGPGTIDAGQANNPNATVSNLSTATATTFRWTTSNGVCTNSIDDVIITVNALPTTAVAGANQTLCNVTTATLAATPVTSGTGTWSVLSGPGTIDAGQANNPSATVSNLSATTATTFRWTTSNGVCATSTDDVTITVNALPTTAVAGANQTLCNVTTTTLAATPVTSGTGTWTVLSGPGTIDAGQANNPSATVSNLSTTTPTTFRWTTSNGVCANSIDDVIITVNALPTTAVAGANQTLCNVTTATLAATPVTSGTGTWTVLSGPGTIDAGQANNPSATVSNLSATTATTFRWTTNNGACATSTDDVTITVNALPTTAVAGANQTLCNVTTATLAATPVTSGTGTWTVLSGPGTIDAGQANNPSATVSNLSATTVTTFRWTTSNGVCAASTDDVTITVNALPTNAVAGANQTLCNVTNTTLTANAITSGTGTWTVLSGPGTIDAGQANNPSATVSNLSTTTPTTFRWTTSNGVCATSTDDVTITVNALPTTAAAGADQNLCNVTTTTLTANIPAVGTGTWSVLSGPGTIAAGQLNNPGATVNNLSTATPTTLRWTITNGSCTPSTNDITITVSAPSTTSIAGTNQNLCNVTTTTLAANSPTVGVGTWTKISGPGVISAAEMNNPNAQVTGLTSGSVTRFQWSITNGSCPTSTSTVDITIDATPTMANAGTDQTLCNATSTTLAGNTPAVGSGTWSVLSGPGTIAAGQLNNPTATVNNLSNTTPTVLRWTITNGTCSSQDDVTININALPTTANAGTNQQVCGVNTTTTVNLSANAPTSGTGMWSVISGSGTFGNASVANTTVSGLSYGPNVLRWTVTNGTCAMSTSDITITLFEPPTVANAGASQNLCGTIAATNATLTANNATVGTGAWTIVSGSGTFSNLNDPGATVSGLSYGANVFRWTITNGNCMATTSEVTITLNQPPTVASAGPAQSLCGLNTITNATLAANPASIGTGTWTVVSGSGSFSNINTPNATVSGLSYGPNVFRWTITNGNCTATTSDVTITLFEPPTVANAGITQTLCGLNTTTVANITANTPTVGTGQWTVVSGSGVFANANTPNTTISGLTYGANVFRWTISNGSCMSTSSDVTITLNQPPTTANAGADQILCGLTGATNATLAANNPTVGAGTWTVVSGSGTFSNANTSNATVSGLTYGANVFRWTISNGNCPTSTSDVTITLNQPPTMANAGTTQTICATTTTLTANTPAVGTGTWTLISGSGTITNANNPITTVANLGVGINTFQWTISNGNCTNSTATVTITRQADPTIANAGPDQTVCGTTAILAGNTATSGTGTWTLVVGSGTITNPASPNTTVTNLGIGTNIFKWTITNGICVASESNVNITRDAPPTTSIAGGNQTTCESIATLTGNTPATGTGQWSIVSGSGTITDPGNPNTQVSNLGIGVNIFRWTITNSCSSSSSSISITREATPSNSNAGVNQTVCATTAILAANNPTVGTGQWTVIVGSGVVTDPTNPNSGVTGLSVGVNTFQWTITNGTCTPSVSNVSIVRDAEPTISSAGVDQVLCGTTSATLAGNTASVGTGTWTQVSGPNSANIINPGANNSGVTNLVNGTYVFRWTIANGTCPNSTDEMNLTVVGQPNTTVNLLVGDVTFCTGQQPATFVVTVSNTEVGVTYELRDGATVLGTQVGNGSLISFANIPTPATSRTYDVYAIPANVGGTTCPAVRLADQAQVTIDNCNFPVAGVLNLRTDNCTNIDLNLLTDSTNQAQGGVTFTLTPVQDLVTAAGGIVNMQAGGNFKYEPRTSFIGRDSVRYEICNSNNSCATGVIYISIEACTNDAPEAKNDIYTIDNCRVLTGNVLLNDIDANSNTLKLSMIGSLLTNRRGVVSLEADGSFTYTPPKEFVGIDTLAYQVCDDASVSKCDSALLIINVTECGEIFIPNGFSPNDDGKHDTYVILGVDQFKVDLSIYNRWGSRVYFQKDYKNDWDGFANQGNLSGQRLPDGTYYYVIDLNNGTKPFAGYLILRR